MNTVALYMRLSSEDDHEGESYSIGNQRELLHDYVRGRREFDGCNILEFLDDGYTGRNFERPGVKQMLALAGKTVDCIIVKDFSRFGRNLVEVGDYLDQVFPFLGVRFIAVNEGYDSGQETGSTVSLDVSLKAMVYEMYSRDISEKINCVKQAKMRRGEYLGGIGFYGYKKSETEKNKLVVDEPAAEVVRRIFRMASEGMIPAHIALELNREGIPSPLMYRKANHTDGKRGWKVRGEMVYWMRQNVRRILVDERYTGCMVSRKRVLADVSVKKTVPIPREEWIVAENTHEAIVTREVFRQAQTVLKHYETWEQKKPFHKFRGIVRCACCGNVLIRKAGKKPYYFCLTAQTVKNTACTDIRLEESVLEDAVSAVVKAQIRLYMEEGQNRENRESITECLQDELRGCQSEISRCKALQMALFEDYAEGRVDKSSFLSRKQEISECQERENRRFAELSGRLAQAQEKSIGQEGNWEKLGSASELSREMLVELVKEIRVSGKDRMEIVWNFRE